MTFIEIAEIEFTSKKSCFISIPKNWRFKTNDKLSVFRIKCLTAAEESSEVLMSWSGDTTNGQNVIQINGLFANKLGFSHKQQVLVTYVPNPESNGIANAIKCYLKPITENDWEILSMNSQFIESNLLNQIRVLVLNQTFPVWITNQSNVCLFVQSFRLTPNTSKAVILNNFTEVIVCPPNTANESIDDSIDGEFSGNSSSRSSSLTDQRIGDSKSEVNQSMISSVFGFVKSFITNTSEEDLNLNQTLDSNETSSVGQKIEINCGLSFDDILRVLPFFEDNENQDKDLVNTVFVSKSCFNDCETNYFVSKLTHILSPNERKRENQRKEKTEETKSDSNSVKTVSKLLSEMPLKETLVLVCGHKQCPDSSVFICDSLRRQMGLSITSRVYLSPISEPSVPLITELTLCPIGLSFKRSKDLLKTDLSRLLDKQSAKTLFITNGSLIHLCGTDFLAFHRNESSVYGITRDSINGLLIEICEPFMSTQKGFSEIALPLSCVKDIDRTLKPVLNNYKSKPFAGFHVIFNECLNFLKLSLKLDELSQYLYNLSAVRSHSLLIHGQKGSGKSHLISALINELSNSPHFVYIQYIDCHSLKGKRIETIKKSWNNCLAECLHRQPSIVVFEDLDAIASVVSKPGQEESAEALHSERVALLFVDLIERYNRNDISFGDRIAVIATSKTYKSLQTALVQTRGKHMFQKIIELTAPDLRQTIDIISKLIAHKFGVHCIESHISFDVKDIAIKCKGYLPLDISALIDRAFHNCFLISKTNCVNELVLTEDNFMAAFDGFSPINLRGLDLELKTGRRLSDVGGLADVKKCLMETILWSIKYPLLFARLPLKAQTSVMLFGAPGTGKTLVIEAIANECGINFIGIKGPELLSKYVGASEQSVRDLFMRAQAAKPCILFFDEFDALAPRRGHDSTGVTDRVVNQLLTQLDGFEELGTGVYVLSATSRPDLIDPALLRPGRFDKCLYCPLPNQEERLEILNALTSRLGLDSDIDLEVISYQTNHYSGADLQALVYSAQLEALHNTVDETTKHFSEHRLKASDWSHNESLEFMASYMRSVETGFVTDLDGSERQKLIEEIDIYLPNTQIDCNNTTEANRPSTHNLIAIQQKHLLSALKSTRPSINENERKRYDKTFQSFVASGGQSFNSSSALTEKRVTLA